MIIGRLWLPAALSALAAALSPAATANAQISPQQVEALDREGTTQIVVRREPGLTAAERTEVRQDADVTLVRFSTLQDTELVKADKGDLAEAVAALNRDPDVVFAEPVTIQTVTSTDQYFGSLWGLENTGQQILTPGGGGYYPAGRPDADMDVPEAWGKATGAGVTVAIVDSGLLSSHPDLQNQIATNAGELGTDGNGLDKRTNGIDDDGNGFVDDWQGWDFVRPGAGIDEGDGSGGPDNDPQDDHGHGTHVAGTVAAQANNTIGIAGVAYGAKIMPLRALDKNGRGSSLNVAEAFDYAGKMGVRVVNASLGGVGLDQSQLSAIQAHPNTLYVIAAGNDNVNVDATPYGPCALPAANILCVGASDQHDAKAGFSNYGAQNVDVFAPGQYILSTLNTGGYGFMSGTSMASPNTAGVAALVLSARPGMSALDVKSAIMGSVDARADLASRSVTGGRVNADRALVGTLGGTPANLSPPVITGTPRQGITLSASTGAWNPVGSSYSYVWQRSTDTGVNWTTLPGASSSTYVPGASDIDALLRVTVIAGNAFGVASATSAPVGPVTSGTPLNIARPVIAGTLRRGQTLNVTSSWNPVGTSYAYQWQRSADGVTWTPIGTSSPTYTLTPAEREHRIRVIMTATNPYGQATSTSDPVGPVANDPPVNTAPPTVSGSTQRTNTLSASPGTWDGSGNAFRYQWEREDTPNVWTAIAGATSTSYKLTKDDEGLRVRVAVNVSNADGSVDLTSDPTATPISPFPPANTVAPVVSGTPQRGKVLSATRGTWTGPDNFYAFQWQRDFGEGYVDIAGATGAAYTLVVADVGALVRVVVTASNPDAAISEASGPTLAVLSAGPVNQTPPAVSGGAQRGQTLNGVAGTWAGTSNSFAYQWESSPDGSTWTDIPGATQTTLALTVDQVNRFVRMVVTATNADGTARASSAATQKVTASLPVNTVAPTLSNTIQRGTPITSVRGTWSGTGNAFTYQWQRNGVDIADATASGYTPTVDDVGAQLRVLVTATNPDGTATAASAATTTVPSSPPASTARPAITGIAERGRTLTATGGSWSGVGNSYTFQWQSSPDGATWTAITGATSLMRSVAPSDVGRYLRLLVTATNPEGTTTATSVATALVGSAPPVNSARPTLTGDVKRASTLVGNLGSWTGNDNTYDYQWQRSSDGSTWTAIAGAIRPAYELAVADVGATVRLLITATNPDGTSAASSAATVTVPASPPVNTVRPPVTGAAKRGVMLNGSNGTWTGIGNTLVMQWQRSADNGTTWVNIDGETRASYLLVSADVGKVVRLLVTGTNPEGTAAGASLPTAVVVGDGPVSTVAPAINGAAERGTKLTSVPGTWSGTSNVLTYQWQRSTDGMTWTDIAGATGRDLELLTAHVGGAVRVIVTATNPDGTGTGTSAATATVRAAPPVNTVPPTVSGPMQRTSTLVAANGAWTGAGNTYTLQWQRDPGTGYVDIPGATATNYTLGVTDVGKRIRIKVTVTNPDATVVGYSIGSAVVTGGAPANSVAPSIIGAPKRASALTSTLGEWAGIENEFSYQWQRRLGSSGTFTDIAGVTAKAYMLDSADVGMQVRLKVTATNPDGTASAFSGPTATVMVAPPVNLVLPIVTGFARQGATLTALFGEWTPVGPAYSYQWQSNGVDIPGATTDKYYVRPADAGKAVRVKITATNMDGSASAFSAATASIAAPPVSTGAPTTPTGTPRQMSVLTPNRGTWDTPGATFTYTWLRCPASATAITDACERVGGDSTYTATAADVGSKIGVRVHASSPGGTGSADSPLTAVIGALALTHVTPPSITGAAYVGETLLGDAGRWTFPNRDVSYDWRRCAPDGVSGCTSVGDGSARYKLVADDANQTIVLVVAARSSGQDATASSAALAIAPRPVPGSVGVPAVNGIAQRGNRLTADNGTWTNSPTRFSYQWLRCDGAGSGCQPITGATADGYALTRADQGFSIGVLVTATNAAGSGTARSSLSGSVVAGPPVNTAVPVISSPSPLIQQGVTLSVNGFTWATTDDTVFSFSWERCDSGGCVVIPGATGDRYELVAADVGKQIVAVSTATNVDGAVSARSAATVAVTMSGPRWKTLPLISTSPGRVGDPVTITPGNWSGGPVVTTQTTELMRCTNVCVTRGTSSSYSIVSQDLGAIMRVRETATNVGGSSVVWSARYVGPIISPQAATGVMSVKEAPLKNSEGETLALAKLTGGAKAAAAAKPKKAAAGPQVALRRPAGVKGKITAWACPASVAPGATPGPCSKRVKLAKKASISLPATTDGKVRVVVVRGR